MKEILNKVYKNTHIIYKALIFISTLFLIVYFFPKEGKFKYDFEKNKPWQYESLYAPFDFTLKKTDAEIQKEKDSVAENIPFFIKKESVDIESIQKSVFEQINQNTSLTDEEKTILKKSSHNIIFKIYKTGIIEQLPKNAKQEKLYLIEEKTISDIDINKLYTTHQVKNIIEKVLRTKPKLRKILLEILYSNLKTNLKTNNFYRQKILKEKLANISTNKILIPKGKFIISKGEIVNNQKFQELYSLKMMFREQNVVSKKIIWIYTGYSILVAIVLAMLLLFLAKYREEIFENNVKLSLIVFNVLFMIIITTLVVKFDASYVYLVPMAILPLILKAFFDARVGLFVHVLTILLLGFVVPNSFEFIFIQIMAGIVTILTVSELTKRSNLFNSVGKIIFIYIIGYFAFHLIHEGNIELINGKTFILFLLNGVLTIALSHQLILFFEKIFGLVSDVSLLELSNTNSKLLKMLSDKAPGTFNHSLQVANLAEAAANEIKANSLLVRAGALYHDIGKMNNPFFFTENQTSGVNHHDDLAPEESARIIIQHIIDGIEIARKNNLPDRVIDFIRTHHGTSLVQYFYKKALENNQSVDKENFRYPGPNPFSKETAILMMADSVEAASKSLREPTAQKIEEFVEKIIDNQLYESLLNNADITLKEINLIKKLFKKKLKNIYHLRVEYPK